MSVFVSDFHPPGNPNNWTVTHDDAPGGAHAGAMRESEITHALDIDGSPNHQMASVVCPECGSVSMHPVGGGAQPPLVQELFVRLVLRDDCPCPDAFSAGGTFDLAKEHVKVHTEEMDGPGRWQMPEDIIP
jgi:hypothetical protein